MEPQNVGENMAGDAVENIAVNANPAANATGKTPESLTESLLTELRDLSRKRLFFQKVATGCMAGILVLVFLVCVIIVPKAITTLSHINSVSVKAENSLDEIDVMTKGITSATDSLNELVSGNSASLTEAVTSLSQIDFDGLNQAIRDLQDAAGPMAALMKRFR
ncbi:MAG: hypothetical protein K6A61_12585 [Butyrivibrio sp.]|nr:hypothetical protein [Butyrivibrio sp.]